MIKTEISICLASIRPIVLNNFFKNIQETAKIPERIEVIVKIDNNDEEMLSFYKKGEYKKDFTFPIKFIVTDPPFYEKGDMNLLFLSEAYNQCAIVSNPEAYFISFISDEIRFSANDWDEEIIKTKHSFKDDIFAVHFVENFKKNKLEYSLDKICDMIRFCYNYKFYSRKLFNMMEGLSFQSSSDVWYQIILQFLKLEYGKDRLVYINKELLTTDTTVAKVRQNKEYRELDKLNYYRLQHDKKLIEYSYKRIAKNISDYIDNFKEE